MKNEASEGLTQRMTLVTILNALIIIIIGYLGASESIHHWRFKHGTRIKTKRINGPQISQQNHIWKTQAQEIRKYKLKEQLGCVKGLGTSWLLLTSSIADGILESGMANNLRRSHSVLMRAGMNSSMIGKLKRGHNCLKQFSLGTKADSVTSLGNDGTHEISTVQCFERKTA